MQPVSERERRNILGIQVTPLEWNQALEKIKNSLEVESPQLVFNFLNANTANIAKRNPEFCESLARSVVLPDGIGVDIASRVLYGKVFPANLNGTDFVPAVFVYCSTPLKVALIGGQQDILEKAVANFKAATPWHEFYGVSHGFFDKTDSSEILTKLTALNPDITLVGMGSPRQELWIRNNLRQGHGRVVFGVGALFDFVSGSMPRAPEMVRRLRLEWAWRLALEPSRLWQRYLIGNPLFLFHLLGQTLTRKKC